MTGSLIYSLAFHSLMILLTILSLPFMLREPIDLPPIVSVELIQISDKTNIPYAPKARKIIEENKKKEKERLVSEQAPPAAKAKEKPDRIPLPNDQKEEKKIVKKKQNPEEVKPEIRQSSEFEKKEIIDISYAGDIVGLHDTGNFKIGDTLTSGEILNYRGIPSFSPEHFRYINNADPMKAKQLNKGIDQLMDEGVAQLFTLHINNRKVIGTVGALQYEVIQYRLEHEYGAKCTYENFPVHKACWIEADENNPEFQEFKRVKQKFLALDKQNQLVFLADSSFSLQMTQQKYPSIKFHFTSEYAA